MTTTITVPSGLASPARDENGVCSTVSITPWVLCLTRFSICATSESDDRLIEFRIRLIVGLGVKLVCRRARRGQGRWRTDEHPHTRIFMEVSLEFGSLELGPAGAPSTLTNGNHCPSAAELVSNSYLAAVITRKRCNSLMTDTLLLNRMDAHEDVLETAAELISRLTLA
jgi:hypothetical protein